MLTPDSFSDGSELFLILEIIYLIKHCNELKLCHKAGATFIDVGGESTKPGASIVSLEEEMDRVLPLVERIHNNIDVIVSLIPVRQKLCCKVQSVGRVNK